MRMDENVKYISTNKVSQHTFSQHTFSQHIISQHIISILYYSCFSATIYCIFVILFFCLISNNITTVVYTESSGNFATVVYTTRGIFVTL